MEPQLMTAESLHYWEMSRLHEEEREALMMEQYYQQQQYQNGYQFVKSCSSPLPEEEVM